MTDSLFTINNTLQIRQQLRTSLYFIQNRPIRKLGEKPPWISLGKLPGIQVFQQYIGLVTTNMTHQCRLTRLTRAGYSNHWILSKKFFESVFSATIHKHT